MVQAGAQITHRVHSAMIASRVRCRARRPPAMLTRGATSSPRRCATTREFPPGSL